MASFEKSLLAHLSTVENMSRVWDMGLRAQVFEDPMNQQVFEFITAYWHRNEMEQVPPETVLVAEFPGYRVESGEEALTWLVEELQKRYVRNNAQEMLIGVAEALKDNPIGALNQLHSRSWEAKEAVSPRHNRSDMASTVIDRQRRYEQRLASGALDRGMTLGFDEVDSHTGGLLPGELGIVAAYTGVGKSFSLTNAALKARQAGFTPVIFTLEQAIGEFEDRIDCFASGVGYGRFTRGQLSVSEYDRHRAAQRDLGELGPIYVEKPERGERTVVDLVGRCRQLGGDYLIIDQLSHMDPKPTRYRMDTTEKHAEIIFDLKDEIDRGSTSKLSCLMAVQFNRTAAAASAKGEALGAWQIANSADIERTVDLALSLRRTKEMRANRTMVMDVLKARRSDENSWLLAWHLNERSELSVIREYTQERVS